MAVRCSGVETDGQEAVPDSAADREPCTLSDGWHECLRADGDLPLPLGAHAGDCQISIIISACIIYQRQRWTWRLTQSNSGPSRRRTPRALDGLANTS